MANAGGKKHMVFEHVVAPVAAPSSAVGAKRPRPPASEADVKAAGGRGAGGSAPAVGSLLRPHPTAAAVVVGGVETKAMVDDDGRVVLVDGKARKVLDADSHADIGRWDPKTQRWFPPAGRKGKRKGAAAEGGSAAPAAVEPGASDADVSAYVPLSDRLNPAHARYDPAFKARWATLSKARKQEMTRADTEALAARAAGAPRVDAAALPFPTDPDDHCETDPQAYTDLAPVLRLLAARLGTTPAALRIWDPFYCAGSVTRRLAALGFACVRNVPEDAYAAAADPASLPPFDVIVTNPPFSADHLPRTLRMVAALGKPACLLLPSFVIAKPYFAELCGSGGGGGGDRAAGDGASKRRRVEGEPAAPAGAGAAGDGGAGLSLGRVAHLYPRKRYVFWTPRGARPASAGGKDGDGAHRFGHAGPLGVRTSPFLTHWFLALGKGQEGLLAAWEAGGAGGGEAAEAAGVGLARNARDLPSIFWEGPPMPPTKAAGGAGGGARR